MLIHTYKNKKFGMGLGDFIRGSISCYQLCKLYNIPLKIDFRHHPIGNYIAMDNPGYLCDVNVIHDFQDIRKFTISCLKMELIKKYRDIRILRKKYVYVYTNVWPRFPLTTAEKQFVRSFMVPTRELEDAIQSTLPTHEDYEVVHIRSGDLFAFNTQVGETFQRSESELLERLKTIADIKNNSSRAVIVISDSAELKKLLARTFGVLTTNTQPSHCALEKTDVKDTLIDYFILSRAKKIHQFSVHHWGSGFSDTVNWVYDVPIVKHQI